MGPRVVRAGHPEAAHAATLTITSPRWPAADRGRREPVGQVTPLLDFSDATHGWLVLDNITWRTVNGGLTWTQS
jgi:hypothetical protein